jgi:hypothetical protein
VSKLGHLKGAFRTGRWQRHAAIGACVALVWLSILLVMAAPSWAQNYTVDSAASNSLTAYLRKNRLPLVGAQVQTTPDGQKRLMLYGFVATDFGRQDAETKALAHLGGSGVTVENRIAVRPEIGQLNSDHHATSSTSDASSNPDQSQPTQDSANLSFDQVMDAIQHTGFKDPPGEEDLNGP